LATAASEREVLELFDRQAALLIERMRTGNRPRLPVSPIRSKARPPALAPAVS